MLVAIVAGLGVTAGATPTQRTAGARAAVPAPRPSCPVAARVEIAVADEIDEVRAIVDTPTTGGASAVTVLSGRSDRDLMAFGAGVWGLTLSSPLPAGRVIVAVEPVLDAPAAACVDHVELLRRGAIVARVVPR